MHRPPAGHSSQENKMSIARPFSLFPSFLLLVSCVTINVYFPAAAAEKAADRIIEHVLGEDSKKDNKEKGQQPAKPDSSYYQDTPAHAAEILIGLLEIFVSEAHAAADIDISSPAIDRLKASMQARHARLSQYYKAGVIGYSADGLVAQRDLSSVGLRERGEVKKLLAQENRDRNALYKELARANGHPEWEDQIRATFARRWVAKAPRGWYHRDRSGTWHRK